MKIATILFASLLLMTLPGCVGVGDDIPVAAMGPELQYRGFSVQRPKDSGWVSKRSEQNPMFASFRMPLQSQTHTLYAQIRHERVPSNVTSPAAFKRYIDQQNQTIGSRYELISYSSKLSRRQGQPSVDYSIKVLDKAPLNANQPLVMTIKGFSILHPSFTYTMIDAHYSERGTASEVNGSMDSIGRNLLNGITLQSTTGNKL